MNTRFLWAVFALLFPWGAIAGGGGATGGSTEITQIANNGQLATQVSYQAQSVATQVRQEIVQLKQYITELQNMIQIPINAVRDAIKPYTDTISALNGLYTSVQDIASSGKQLQSMIQGDLQTMAAMKKDPKQFLQWIKSQSSDRQNMYSQRLDQELKAIENFARRYDALQAAQARIPGIDGTVKGLAELNNTTAMAVGEMMSMHQAIRQEMAMKTNEKLIDEVSRQTAIDGTNQNRDAEKAVIDKFRAMNKQ